MFILGGIMATFNSNLDKLNQVSSGSQPGKTGEVTVEPGKEFIFRLRNGREVGRAETLSEFLSRLRTIPLESIEYHFNGRHFSPWLRYLKLNPLADSIEKLTSKGERLREDILEQVSKFWLK